MAAAKNVYALMLALVIVLSGCFGNTAPDTDGQSNTVSNIAPLIEIGNHAATGGTATYSSATGELIGFSEWNVSIYRAVADLDGTIVSSGWDFDLDGTIDHSSTALQSVDNLSIPAAHWTNASTVVEGADALIATIAFIATDDSGETTGELLTISNDEIFDFSWLGTTTRNSYTADDAAASTSSATDDVLMSVRWQHAEDDLDWAFVVIRLSVGDSTFDCSTAGGDDCTIGQDGNDDALWETGEFLTLSESGADIANGATTISLYVTYRGTAVAGDDSVSVS
ncbi:MAG: hypothetical protein QF722_04575 [Candidatus Thalassarchaeaceae archaeon]|nr:hypothetical protein [Candidatus Thalassarchaeaceae archaeon]